jgi:hypothetical protein
MRRLSILLTLAFAAISSCVFAQQQATTIQLPTFSFFTVQTSVLVPDSGGAYLGGISRAQSGSRYRGMPLAKGPLLGNRGYGSSFQTGGMSVHATIIDNSEIDAAVLGAALDARGVDPEVTIEQLAAAQRAAEAAAAAKAVEDNLRGATSVADIRVAQQSADDAKQAEARELFVKAEAYAAKNQPGLAKVYYKMAVTRASGDLRTEILTKLAPLEGKRNVAPVATRSY